MSKPAFPLSFVPSPSIPSPPQPHGDQSCSLDHAKPLLEKPHKCFSSLLTGWEWCQAGALGRETFQILDEASGADVACGWPTFRELGGQQAWTGIWIAHKTVEQRPVDNAPMERPRKGQLSGVPGETCGVPKRLESQ